MVCVPFNCEAKYVMYIKGRDIIISVLDGQGKSYLKLKEPTEGGDDDLVNS